MLTPVEERLRLVKDGSVDLVDATNFKRFVRSLRYQTITRPDIIYGVEIISRLINLPWKYHWQAAKITLRYIKDTLNNGIFYSNNNKIELVDYTNSD